VSVNQQEVLSCFKVLVCMAQADGQLLDEECSSLAEAFGEIQLPEGVTVESLLNEKMNVDELLGQISSSTAQELVYQSAYTMANVDGNCSVEEQELLHKIANSFAGFGLWEKKERIHDLQCKAERSSFPKQVKQITDSAKREIEVDNEIRDFCFLNAVLGAFPFPGIAIAVDLYIYWSQLDMVQNIGERWGYDRSQADLKKALFGSIGWTGARIAVSNLAKLVPVFGSAVGAATAFASTWAIGKVANQYFALDCQMDAMSLKAAFKKAKQEGDVIYKQNEAAIAAKQKELEPQMQALSAELEAGRITQEEYQVKLRELV
jgi:uncharacterized protein (DUF697 family)